jgi:hypothetical protein
MEPAHQNLNDQNANIWYAAARPNDSNVYMVYETNAANPGQTGLFGYFAVAVPAYTVPPSAAQPAGCNATLDTLDNRFQNQGTQNGDLYYQVHTENLSGFPTPRYYQISGLLAFNPVVLATNFVYATNTSHDFNPSIAADGFDRYGLNWSVTDPANATLPSVHFADNNGGNPVNASGINVFTSASCMSFSGGGVSRWGDYSQVSVDFGPGTVANTSTKIFWIENETVPSVNFWSTEIAKINY